MTDELVKRLKEYGHSLRAGLGFKHMPELFNEAADALEAMAGEVERLTGQRDAEHQRYLKTYDLMGSESHRAEAAEAERDRLKAALVQAVAMLRPHYEDDYLQSKFSKALGGDAS